MCGDTHGQFYDVLRLFEINGVPSPGNPYLFNGDFVDRGSFSTEVVLTFLAFKLLYPNHFFMSRGESAPHTRGPSLFHHLFFFLLCTFFWVVFFFCCAPRYSRCSLLFCFGFPLGFCIVPFVHCAVECWCASAVLCAVRCTALTVPYGVV